MGIDEILAGEEFFKFYNMQLVAGEWISDKSDVREVNIMETTARTMGWTPEEAIGKHIFYCNKEVEPMTVIGVIKDCAYRSPTKDLPHTVFVNTNKSQWMWPRCFVLLSINREPGKNVVAASRKCSKLNFPTANYFWTAKKNDIISI